MPWVPAAIVFCYLIGLAGWFLAVLWRRLKRSELRSLPPADRLRRLGLGVLLLPVVAALSAEGDAVTLAAPLVALALWTFAPRFITDKIVPVALALLGYEGIVKFRDYLRGIPEHTRYGLASFRDGGSYSQLVLFQACLFGGLGLYLLWRSSKDIPWARKLLWRPGRTAAGQGTFRWGILLLPAAAILIELLGRVYWLGTAWWGAGLTFSVAVAATLLVIRFPALAADVAIAGFILLGIYGVALGLFWPTHVPLPSPYNDVVRYGAVLVDSRASAVLAGVEGLALFGFGLWLMPRALDNRTRALLRSAADADLATRVVRLTRTRADAVDTANAEIRRLERDLHDGAQARLIALGMSLRAAERLIPTDPNAAAALVAEARDTSVRVLADLRDLVRGICPPVLADRGLADAVKALALDTPLPVDVEVDLAGRPDLPVETACYFAVAEALVNVVKHSGARHAYVRIWHAGRALRITVTDDGSGGADPQRGSGLLGLERRLGMFDGVLAVNSPPGGPTIIAIEVPCAIRIAA